MEARQTDKLFRDKLKNATTTPQLASWDKLETMLDEKKKPGFYLWRVAAVLVLLIVSAGVIVFWGGESQSPVEVAVEQSSETIKDSRRLVPPVARVSEPVPEREGESPSVERVKSTKQTPVEPVQKSAPEKEEPIPVLMQREEQPLAQAEEAKDTVGKPPKKKYKSIRITYKRGTQKEMLAKVDTTEGSKVKDFWAQTREINPADMWADIRDAKDNLFQRNSKKNNVKNLNK